MLIGEGDGGPRGGTGGTGRRIFGETWTDRMTPDEPRSVREDFRSESWVEFTPPRDFWRMG